MFGNSLLRPLSLTVGLTLAAATLSACNHDDGPAEELGEKIDESVEKAGDAIEDATDR